MRLLTFLYLVTSLATIGACNSSTPVKQESEKAAATDSSNTTETENTGTQSGEAPTKEQDLSLFDGMSLEGWEVIEFGGEGDIDVVDGAIRLNAGDPLTGICVTEDVELPNVNYEVALDGMKLDGTDFFCALTFPVNDSFCTLVVGGWGGTLVGLSNLDGQDASENSSKLNRKFEKDRWYAIRVQVLADRIKVWIDDEQVIDESTKGVEVSIRNDVISTTPLGIFSFATTSSIRNINLRMLDQP